MSIRTGKLTVFFEEPFWVGIFERVENGKLSVSKVTFGTEPKDYEIWEFVLKEYDRLRFSPSVEVTEKELTKNPKKLQREIHKQMLDRGVGTKSQQALKLQQEQRKQQRKSKSRDSMVMLKCLELHTPYLDVSGCIDMGRFSGKIISRDTLDQAVHRVPHRFWFIKWGTKAIRQDIVCRNPYSQITYSEYIELK